MGCVQSSFVRDVDADDNNEAAASEIDIVARRIHRELTNIAEAARGGISFESLKEVTTSLLRVDEQVWDVIARNKKDVWRNNELMEIIIYFLRTRVQGLKFCKVVEECVQQIKERHELHIQAAIDGMPAARDATEGECRNVREALQNFLKAPNPFSEDFCRQSNAVDRQYEEMKETLESKKEELMKQMQRVEDWMKVSETLLEATAASLCLCRLVANACCEPQTSGDFNKNTGKPRMSMEKLQMPLTMRRDKIRVQQDLVERTFSKVHVNLEDLRTISSCLDNLENHVNRTNNNIKFGEDQNYGEGALKVVVFEIRKKQRNFILQLEDLQNILDATQERM